MDALIDRTFYEESYGGDAVPAAAFPRIAKKATATLQGLTQGRARAATGERAEAVKLAVCAIADLIWQAEHAGGRLPTTESTGGGDYAATYEDVGLNEAIRREAQRWLGSTVLLYRGL